MQTAYKNIICKEVLKTISIENCFTKWRAKNSYQYKYAEEKNSVSTLKPSGVILEQLLAHKRTNAKKLMQDISYWGGNFLFTYTYSVPCCKCVYFFSF